MELIWSHQQISAVYAMDHAKIGEIFDSIDNNGSEKAHFLFVTVYFSTLL